MDEIKNSYLIIKIIDEKEYYIRCDIFYYLFNQYHAAYLHNNI